MMTLRVGFGYDVHRLSEGRELVLGGVNIPYEKGLHGHSDADVLLHSIADALLGALALGDIGQHFPDDDPAYAGISSLKLLDNVYGMVREAGYQLANCDTTIVAEKPKLQPYIEEMRKNIADCLSCQMDQISVKATTHEKLGALGRGEGIAAYASLLLVAQVD